MYVNSPGGSVTAGNNNFCHLTCLPMSVSFWSSFIPVFIVLTFPRNGYIRYYEAYPA